MTEDHSQNHVQDQAQDQAQDQDRGQDHEVSARTSLTEGADSKADFLEKNFEEEGAHEGEGGSGLDAQGGGDALLSGDAPKVFPQAPITDEAMALRLLEAILFASPEPVTKTMLEAQMGVGVDVPDLLQKLAALYQDRGVNLVETDGAWGFRTAVDLASMLTITKQPRRKLPRAAAEVLAIIAYHQPVTRAEIESIRGVETSKGTLDMLLELDWIKPGKRREVPGRPLTWKTTPAFLSHFNLGSLHDLPGLEDLKASGLLDARATQTFAPQDTIQGLVDTTLGD